MSKVSDETCKWGGGEVNKDRSKCEEHLSGMSKSGQVASRVGPELDLWKTWNQRL